VSYSTIAMCPEKHQDVVHKLWKENLSQYFENRLNWLDNENPYGQAKIFLAIFNDTEEIIGSGSSFPRKMFINGRDAIQGVAVDFNVKQDHRTVKPAVKIQRAVAEGVKEAEYDYIFVFPNQASKGVFIRVGYKVLGLSKNYAKVLRSENKLINFVKISFIAKIAGFFLDRVLWVMDARFSLTKPRNLKVEILKSCDERFDKLWESAKTNYDIIGERSSTFLDWRYSKFKGQQYLFFCLFDKTKKNLNGYITYSINSNIARIEDIFAESINDTMVFLLLEFSKQMRKQKVDSISFAYLGNDRFLTFIKKLNFVERPGVRPCMLLLNKNYPQESRKTLLDKNKWFVFDGEMDF